MKRVIIGAIALLTMIAVLAGCAAQGSVKIGNEEDGTVTTVPTLSVTGTGEMDVKPDMATLNLGFNITKPTAEEATKLASDTVDQIKAKLTALGVKEDDMQTTNLYIYPEYEYNEKGESKGIVGYRASNMLEVKVRDLTIVGTVIDSAVQAGANTSYGISFGLADPLTHQSETLKLAVENAKKKAGVLAEAAGKKLGDILVMTDGTTNIPEVYVQDDRAEAYAKGSSVSISPGTLKVSSSVTVRYEMK
ncbi:MAG: SIMPL domain-containing protein [Christensenellales bacterium]